MPTLQGFVGSVHGNDWIHAQEFTGIPDLMNGVHVRIQCIVFGHVADALTDLNALMSDVITKHCSFPRGGLYETEYGLQERGFTGSVLTEQTGCTTRNGQVEVVEGHMGSIGLGEFLGLDDWFILHGHLQDAVGEDEP